MEKTLQALLLTLTISFAVGARLNLFGWFFIIGIGSILLFGIIHFKLHFARLNRLEKGSYKNIGLILASHILFLCLFLFQVDAGDSREYIVIENILNIQPSLSPWISWTICGFSGFFYLIVIGEISEIPKADNDAHTNDNLLMISVFLILILSITFTLIL